MKVTKRDGRLVDFNSDSIRKQTKLACEGFPVDPGELEMSAGIMFKDGMRTDAIQKALINAARMKVTIDRPYFTYIAARLMLYDLYHTIERYYNVEGSGDVYAKVSILDYINKNKDIIGDFVNKYTESELIELNKEIDGTRDLLFDYAGTKTMILRYIMKRSNIPVSIRNINKDNLEDSLKVSEDAISKLTYDESGKPIFENTPIELPQHMHMLVAMFMAQNEKDKLYWTKKYYYYLSTLKIIAATPINSNSRAKNGSTASCLVVNSDDSIDGIADTYKEIMLGSSAGAGFGRYLGHVRSMGGRIQDRVNASSGKIPNCKVANDITEYIDQRGNRKGALTDTIESWDIDVFDYIDLRKKEGDERGRAQNLFLALSYTDEFMMRLKQYREALKAGDKDPEIYWTLFDPYDVQDLPALYGEAFSKRYREYEEMFKQHPYFFNLNTKTIKISLLAKKIAKSCLEEGMPFSFFKCTTNNMHKHKELGTIYSSNLCVTADTYILTQEYGNIPIGLLVDSGITEATCWNGEEWSLTKLAKTSEDAELMEVKLNNFTNIKATPEHKWYVVNDNYNGYKEVRTHELKPGDKLIRFKLPSVVVSGQEILSNAYTSGLFAADGCETGYGCGVLHLYNEKIGLLPYITGFSSVGKITTSNENNNLRQSVYFRNNAVLPKTFVPNSVFRLQDRLSWLAGLIDGGGTLTSNQNAQSIQLSSTNLDFLKNIRLMLQELGVDAKIQQYAYAGLRLLPTNKGDGSKQEYYCNDGYRLLISGAGLNRLLELGYQGYRVMPIRHNYNRVATEFVKVVSVTPLLWRSATYCGNEPKRHMLMFNGVLTGNCMEFMNPTNFDEVSVCNLGSLNVARLLNDEELKEASELGLRMLDSVIDATEYSSEKAGKTQKTRRSCGLGVLGMGERLANEGIYQTSKEHFQFEENLLSKISHWVDEYNKELAKEKGSCIIDGYRNAYTMCIAPNSTSGIFAGTTNGIEPVFGKEWKEDSKIGVVTMTAPNISINNIAYYQDGFELDQFKLIEIEGIRQKYIDMGISHNIFLDVNKFPNYQIPGSLIIDLIIHAWECKLKSTYYFRSTQQNNDGVLKHSNQISCVGCAN